MGLCSAEIEIESIVEEYALLLLRGFTEVKQMLLDEWLSDICFIREKESATAEI